MLPTHCSLPTPSYPLLPAHCSLAHCSGWPPTRVLLALTCVSRSTHSPCLVYPVGLVCVKMVRKKGTMKRRKGRLEMEKSTRHTCSVI